MVQVSWPLVLQVKCFASYIHALNVGHYIPAQENYHFITSGGEAHGTMMAGLAAAEADNGDCGVGVAYKASISGGLFCLGCLRKLNDQCRDILMQQGNCLNALSRGTISLDDGLRPIEIGRF